MGRLFETPTKIPTQPVLGDKRLFETKAQDLTTVKGLYDLTSQSGLQTQADRALAEKGEENKKFFAGGFISDIFDTLNALQYGIVGTLKGKGFKEGIRTRQSWSDKDALGNFGIPGMIGGIALDIACDPLTYSIIAPWTIAKKIPGITKGAKAIKSGIFGKMATKAIKTTRGIKQIEALEGGTKVGKYFAEKLKWAFGQDPIYKQFNERRIRAIGKGTRNVMDLTKSLADIDPLVANKVLTRGKNNRIIRRSSDEIRRLLPPEAAEKAIKLGDMIDTKGKELFELTKAPMEIYEEWRGKYIANLYEEFEKRPGVIQKIFAAKKIGVSGKRLKKARLTDLAKRKELGEIRDAPYLLARTNIELAKDIENIKLFNFVAKKLSTDIATEGFEKLPITQRLFTTATGEKIQMLSDIKGLNKKLKPVFSALKKTFKADKKVLSEIHSAESSIAKFGLMRQNEFAKFFQAGQKITKEIPKWRRLGTLPDELVGIGIRVKKFAKFDDLMKSDIGIELEKLYQSGKLERLGFKDAVFTKGGKVIKTKGIKSFFNYVKKPFRAKPAKIVKEVAKGNLPKLIKLQKSIEQLTTKTGKLKEIDKRSINDAYRFLEDTISKITREKGEISEAISKVKLGELSGKYVPKHIFDSIQEITKTRDMSEQVIGKVVAGFKFGKVVMNPATHGRNIISNKLLNWWKLGLGPWRIDLDIEAGQNLLRKGKYWKELDNIGVLDDATYAAQELGVLWGKTEAATLLGKGRGLLGKSAKKLGDIYQGEEKFAKMAAYIFKRKQGLGIEDAWKAAESATFNYAQVTPFIRKVRTSLFGFPFITFTAKATPVAIETALKHPGRISAIGKIKQGIESQSDIKKTARERASEPAWVRDGFYIKLPIKDKQGRSAYFDLTYIVPFGDLVSGDFVERQISRETGLKEGAVIGALRKSPFFNFVKEISNNQDFYEDKIWKDSDSQDKQLGDLFRHLTKTYFPPLIADQIPGGYVTKGKYQGQRRPSVLERSKLASTENQYRTLQQEMLRNVGLKIQPVSADIQETYMDWEKKKALETILQEAGITKEFTRTYIPKEEDEKEPGRLFPKK